MLWVFVVRTLTWCSQILEMWSIHTGEQINNSKNPNGKDCVTFHRTTAYHCCHSWHAFTGSCEKFLFLRYDSWSVRPWKYEPGPNQDKDVSQDSCCFFPALVSLALSAPLLQFSREFRMWSTQYFTSLLNERQTFLFTISLSGSAL